MIYGYARVSTDGQSVAAQVDQPKAAGCDKVFREHDLHSFIIKLHHKANSPSHQVI